MARPAGPTMPSMASTDFLPSKSRWRVDGKPLDLGYVVFKPKGASKNAPTRTAYVFNRSGEKGGFRLGEGQGLVPGKYEATVFRMAAHWRSVWAEPLLNGIQAKLNQGE